MLEHPAELPARVSARARVGLVSRITAGHPRMSHVLTRVCLEAVAGRKSPVQFLRHIQKRLRSAQGNVDVASDVNAVIAANVGEHGATNVASSSQSVAYSAGRREPPEEEPSRRGHAHEDEER